ncbi:MAG TPA: hypothetical protein VMB03_29245 [Bryobacteraceae bacterium]|nr:hypothetical protein [Bryobacteraceae bacterium]
MVLIIVIAVIVIAALALFVWRSQRSRALRSRFGPEYYRAVREFGGRSRAEDELMARQRRVENISIRALTMSQREDFAEQWHIIQARFVDDPPGSIREADRLVSDVMLARGYPMEDFERRAEDISVHHPHVVRNYRAGHAIAVRDARGESTTEDLRRGLVFYRDLFDELLETQPTAPRR